MKRGIKEKYFLLALLLVAVVSVSIGFATFSNNLNISSSANVSMDPSRFSIFFSSDPNKLDVSNVIGSNVGATSKPAFISNTGNPTITNIHASFTEPGQSVTYHFYVLNQGDYDAYLTNINFNEIDNKKITKKCIADKWANPDLLEDSCNSVAFEIQVGSESTQSSKQLVNHKLLKGSYEDVYVTIDYPIGSKIIDGKMEITFSDIELIYNTVDQASAIPTDAVVSYSALKSTYYAFGTPTEQSATDYRDVPYNVMISSYEDDKSLCLKVNDGLECFANNNKTNEINKLYSIFGEDVCKYIGTTFICQNNDYYIQVGNAGDIEIYTRNVAEGNYNCAVTSNGLTRCSY